MVLSNAGKENIVGCGQMASGDIPLSIYIYKHKRTAGQTTVCSHNTRNFVMI